MMKITVMMSSGDEDIWEDMADATIDDRGTLVVVSHIPGDEIPGDAKLFQISREIDQGLDLPPKTKTDVFRVCAVYAAGMWMRVEFE